MKQYIFSRDTIEKNFLAAYAEAKVLKDRIIFTNMLTDRQIFLKGEEDYLMELLRSLDSGISDIDLSILMDKMGIKEQYEVLLREGMIE